jgi:hypothetical protein
MHCTPSDDALTYEDLPRLPLLPRPLQDDIRAREVLGWPKRCKLARAFLWRYSYKRLYKRLKLAQLLSQLGVFLAQ